VSPEDFVTNCRTQPPWEFLFTASSNTLHSYELSRLGHAANLRKEINSLLDQWIDENANAMVARVLLELRERNLRTADLPAAQTQTASGLAPANGHSVSDNLLADRLVRPNVARRRE
jgi:hypothetical protein